MKRMLNLFYVPEGYVLVKAPPRKTSSGEIPRCSRAVQPKYLEHEAIHKIMSSLRKRGTLTISEAEKIVHADRIVDPNGRYHFSVEKIVKDHPIDLKLEGKRICLK